MKKFTLLLLFAFHCSYSSAQYLEIGVAGGVGFYQGDLAPKQKSISVGELKPAYSVVGFYHFNGYLSLKNMFSTTTLIGDDRRADEKGRRLRNLHFKTPIYEFYTGLQLNVLNYFPTKNNHHIFTPYFFVGAGLMYFNPQAEYKNQWYDLQPLGTEGQGLPGYDLKYHRLQVNIPFGGGFKINISEEWNIAFELGIRKTFTDYLDDVGGFYVHQDELANGRSLLASNLGDRRLTESGEKAKPVISRTMARGNGAKNDWFTTIEIVIGYNLINKDILSSSINSSHLGCPKF